MGSQFAAIQNAYSSIPQGRGLFNSQDQMSPNQPPMDAREEMIRRFPQIASGGMGPAGMGTVGFPMAPNVEPPIGASQDTQGQFQNIQNMQQPQGAMGAITFPGQGGQPAMGQPNAYPNTINPSDNTGMKQMSTNRQGKGKG
jgi:hypothetical protein